MKKIFISLLAASCFTACSMLDNDNDSIRVYSKIATVQNPDSSSFFSYILDSGDTLRVTSTAFPGYRPRTGQRIIASYGLISTAAPSAGYDYNTKLYDVYQVLTKGVYKVTDLQKDTLGNDPVEIRSMWIGSHFLNVEFNYWGSFKTHYINLLSDTTKIYPDNKVHLEFRHNANSDAGINRMWGVVSFDLNALKHYATGDSINFVIHTKESQSTTKTYGLTWKFGQKNERVAEMTASKSSGIVH